MFDPISIVALTMVAFLLGGTLTRNNLARHGVTILSISFSIVAVTLLVISVGLILVGVPAGLAMILGAIGTATAPAAMNDVIHQSGIENGFTDTLKGIVAIDDVWGLAIFTLIIVLVGQSEDWASLLVGAGLDLGGGIVLGVLIGGLSAKLTGR